jgi:hypothetical protein
MTKKKEIEEAILRATLASVTKEMARPRFAESARKEEAANHRVTKHESFSFSTSLQAGTPQCENWGARHKAANK